MKKILAIVCAIAVFVSSLSGALIFTFADPAEQTEEGSAITLPAVKDAEGKLISLYPDTDLTGLGVVGSDKISVVKNTTDLPFTSLYAATGSDAVNFVPVNAKGHKGIMMYVEIPDIGPVTHNYGENEYTTDQFRFGVNFAGYEKSTPNDSHVIYQYGGTMYSMPVGDSQWTAESMEFYGMQLEYGFKGYVYFPFANFTAEDHNFTEDTVITSVTIRQLKNTTDVFQNADTNMVYYGYVTEENPLVYSIPMFVADDSTTDNPSTKSIVVGEKEYFLDKRNTPYTYAELSAVKVVASSDGVANTTTSNGRRFLKGAQSALTGKLGTTMQNSRSYDDGFNAESYTSVAEFGSVAIADVQGWIVHVSIPKLDNKQTVSFQFTDVNGNNRSVDKAAGGTTWYVLPDGATSWIEKGAEDWYDNYKVIVGDGTEPFSGYIYLPKNCLNNWGGGITNIKSIQVGVLPWRYSNKQPNTSLATPIDVSSVSLVTGFNKDTTLAYSDTNALVDLVTGDVVRTNYEAAKPFYGYETVNDTKNYLTAKAATLKAYAYPRYPVAANTHFQAVGGLTASYVANAAPIAGDLASYKIGGTTGPNKSNYISLEINKDVIGSTTGFLMYIETKGQYAVNFLQGYEKAAGGSDYPSNSYGGTFKILANGATSWTSTVANTPVERVTQLPENFKGYIYIPYAGTRNEGDKVFRLTTYIAAATDNTPVDITVGGISLVSNFTEENAGLIKYNGATETQNMFSGEYYVPVTANTNAPEMSYDYTDYNIMNIGVTKLDGEVKVGEPIPNTALSSGPTEGATMEAVDSRLAITRYPSFKISTGELTTVTYQFEPDEATSTGGKHVMTYVELPEGKSAKLKTGWNVHKNGSAGYGSQYGGQVYILQEGDTAWTALTVTAYNYELPEGFKGYVRYDLANLNLGGALAGTTVDETYSIYQAAYTFSEFEAGIDIYVSAPIMVDEITEETAPVDVAFLNGKTNIAKNIFTGNDFVPVADDTSSEESSSEEVSSDVSSDEASSEEVSSDVSSEESSSEDTSSDVPSEEAPDSFVSATAGKLSEIVDGAGSYTDSFTKINSLTPLNNQNSISITPVYRHIANGADSPSNKVAVFNYSEAFAMADVDGYMFYVDVSANTNAATPVNMFVKNFAALNGGSGWNVGVFGWSCVANTAGRTPTVYLLADDAAKGTNWQAQQLPTDKTDTTLNPQGQVNANNGINLPVGFKGYIYIPSDCYQLNNGNIQSIVVYMSAAANLPESKYYISAPMLVTGFDTVSTYFEGDAAKVNLDTNYIFPADDTSSEESSSEEISSEESSSEEVSSDTSSDTSSDDTPTRPTDEPDYNLPKYTGEALDYTGYSVSRVWVARLNEKVFAGYPFVNASDCCGVTDGNYEVINSIVPITNYPSMKVTAGAATVTVKHYLDSTKTKGAKSALYYVEAPANKSITVSFRINAHKEGGGNAYGNNYSKPIYILAEGSTEWVAVTTTAYNATLPAGFKGYIRQDYKDLAQIGAETDISSVSAYYISLIVGGLAADDTFNISTPMLMDATSDIHSKVAVFVEDDVAARNLFSAQFVLPGDESLGEIRVPKPEVEPDYDLPYYDGAKPDYSEYTIAKAWVARVNEDVFIGYPLSGLAGSNSSFVGKYEFVDSITPITKYPSIKLTANEDSKAVSASIYTEKQSGANAAMYYVELPEGKSASIRIALNFESSKTENGALIGVNYSRKVYILPEGASEWTEVKTDAYYSQLPAGFKGYIRQDYSDLSGANGATPDKEDVLYSSNLYFNVEEGSSIKVSAPILLDKFTSAHVVTGVFVNEDTAVRNLFTGEHVMPGDKSLGEPKQPIPEVEPEYDLPYYDGEKPDYTNYKFSNYWVAKLNDKVFVGYGMPEKAATATGATLFAIDSITPITKYPSIKVTATGETANISFNPVAASAKGANVALFYIEAPADKEITVSYRLNFSKAGAEKNLYGNNYSRPLYIMSADDKNWKSVSTTAYNTTLPAGFKGYIRQDYSDLNVAADVDETWTLYYEGLIINGLEAGDVVNVSAPILADTITSDRLPNGAYIEKDPKAPRELFTGKFLLPGDKDLGGPTVEPDYRIPAYTGTPIDYGKLDIMNVRTAKLNGSIIIGRELSEDIYKINSGKGEAVKSLVGISNYPMLKLTDMEIPVDERITVATANYDWKANLGATSVMFYVQIPEGQDTNFSVSWSWHHEDGRTTGAYNYNGTAYLMGKDQKKWKAVDISKYWIDLPAGYEGYIRFDLKDIWCVYPYDENGNVIYKLDENGNKIYKDPDNKNLGYAIDSEADHNSLKDDKWGLQTAYISLSNAVEGAKSDAIISSPILIDEFIPLQTIQNIAHVDGDTNAARHIFTGDVKKLGEFDETAGAEPNYDIPFHTGKEENYDKLMIMKTRTGRLNYAVLIGEEFSPTALTVGADTVAMPVASIYPLTKYPSIEMKNLGDGDVNVTMKTSPEANAGASNIMFYIKAPADTETAIRFSFSFTNVKDGRTTGAFNYSGNAYIMDKNATEWSYVNISKYYVSLPAGFEGYVRYELAKIHTVYSYDENGKPRIEYDENGKLKILSDGNHNVLDPDWGLGVAYTYMSGIPKGEKGYISAPIMVDEIDETSTTPRATFHNGEKFARDIFTGEVLKRIDLDKPIQKGDTIKKLPDPTTDLKAKLADKTKLGEGKATISWAATEGAAKYVIRVFKNLQGATGLVYNCVGVYETTDTSIEITGLAKNTRYSVVVYALDAEGNEIAVYDYVTVSTVGAKAPDADDTDDTDVPVEDNGTPIWVWIVIGAGALVLLAGGAVVTIVVIKKKKAKVA